MYCKLLSVLLPALFLVASASSETKQTHADQRKTVQSIPLKPSPAKNLAAKKQPPGKLKSAPLDNIRITSKFGPRKHPILKRRSFHNGVDLAAKLNDKVKVISDGVVTYSGARGALGNAVFVSHPKLKVTSIYGHLNKVAVKAGEKVSAGRLIGFAGTTGRSTGVHLHLTMKDQTTGANVEPVKYLFSIANTNTVKTWSGRHSSTTSGLKLPNRTPLIGGHRAVATLPGAKSKPITTRRGSSAKETVAHEVTVAQLQSAIQEASANAEKLRNLYSEGIVARNRYLEAQSAADKLRNQIDAIERGSNS